MANATAKVNRAFRSVTNENFSQSYGTLTSALQLYTGAMVGLTAGGYMAKFDDTAALRFIGIILEDEGNPKIPSDGAASATQGAASLFVDFKQPLAFEIAISGVAITDIGRRVYALDDQTGTLDPSATTYANYIGVVKDLVYAMDRSTAVAGYALVKPQYDLPNGSQIAAVYSANGAVTIEPGLVLITKGSAAALTLADPTTGVHDGLEMRFQSTTAFAHTLDNSAGSGFNVGGAASDIGTWGGAKGDGMACTAYAGKWYANWLRNVTLG